ncbi:hypothetical protein GCM10009095_23680 [Sphingomonas molluscorum]
MSAIRAACSGGWRFPARWTEYDLPTLRQEDSRPYAGAVYLNQDPHHIGNGVPQGRAATIDPGTACGTDGTPNLSASRFTPGVQASPK